MNGAIGIALWTLCVIGWVAAVTCLIMTFVVKGKSDRERIKQAERANALDSRIRQIHGRLTDMIAVPSPDETYNLLREYLNIEFRID